MSARRRARKEAEALRAREAERAASTTTETDAAGSSRNSLPSQSRPTQKPPPRRAKTKAGRGQDERASTQQGQEKEKPAAQIKGARGTLSFDEDDRAGFRRGGKEDPRQKWPGQVSHSTPSPNPPRP